MDEPLPMHVTPLTAAPSGIAQNSFIDASTIELMERTLENEARKLEMRSLAAIEIEAVAGGMLFATPIIGDRRVVGCGTMAILDNILKRFSPRS
jgi:hypothetical protein